MSKDTVILLHGIIRNHFDMMLLEKRMKKEGYACINIKYPSTKHSIEDLAEQINGQLQQNENYTSAHKVHFVAHSMGGLITRHILVKHRPANLGSVVMLGTPNKGSEMADYLDKHKYLASPFHRIFGPSGSQLRTTHTHFEDETIDFPLGIIASDASLNPIGKQVFGAPNDTLVSIESTKLEGMSDHIIIPCPHALMMFDPRIIHQVAAFLKDGKFDHQEKPDEPKAKEPDEPAL
jgi:pimeloyl-ACP methyl ester carboxylesterase